MARGLGGTGPGPHAARARAPRVPVRRRQSSVCVACLVVSVFEYTHIHTRARVRCVSVSVCVGVGGCVGARGCARACKAKYSPPRPRHLTKDRHHPRPTRINHQTSYWRFHGHLVRYAVSRDEAPGHLVDGDTKETGKGTGKEKPTLLFVHGFGASADQWAKCFRVGEGAYSIVSYCILLLIVIVIGMENVCVAWRDVRDASLHVCCMCVHDLNTHTHTHTHPSTGTRPRVTHPPTHTHTHTHTPYTHRNSPRTSASSPSTSSASATRRSRP